ncbi:hypothetical protein A2985_00675 [Candidatus Woesebacteria bacterium RIFCSPLOWO2_01_FULL_43_11]|nr:MAG: hypothetical protein A2985_00675 [Candidatus Woesebacteria bacterium RIFCSPLOWO2_01_FULL_43_11]
MALLAVLFAAGASYAQTRRVSPSPTITPTPTFTPTPAPPSDLTQKTEETIGPLEKLLEEQELGKVWPASPLKYAIRSAIAAQVPVNTIVLLLLLPLIASLIAAARHIIGLRGFGIFLPAALAVTFVATGPIVGIGLFLVIVTTATLIRFTLRKLKVKLQYLPRMALLLWWVVIGVLGVLFLAPLINNSSLSNVSIFPVLILVLLSEDFTRVQLGKSAKVAVNLTSETLILALASYFVLTLKPVQEYALLNPEIYLLVIFIFNLLLGRYVGLRLMEVWRFRKLISS